MRRILVDEARARKSEKRGAGLVPLSLDAMPVEPGQAPHDITDLDDALRRLTVLDPRQGQLVELHVFGGLTYDEIGEVLHISARTVRREWGSARAWLGRELTP
jgi:RNA polymerase sigma factor (TIGR02999 family)